MAQNIYSVENLSVVSSKDHQNANELRLSPPVKELLNSGVNVQNTSTEPASDDSNGLGEDVSSAFISNGWTIPDDNLHEYHAVDFYELPSNDNKVNITSTSCRNKEKTPMSQIAELVRYNKLTHQYKLLNETGPAHQKQFTVCLVLRDNEEYVADGASIKKAQQAAARKALDETKLSRPSNQPRLNQKPHSPYSKEHFSGQNIQPPTVALNDLAAKLNLKPEYSNLPPVRGPVFPPPFLRLPPPPLPSPHYVPPFYGQSSRFFPPRFCCPPALLHTVSLRVGSFNFYGRGLTRQLARHDAAAKALRILKQLEKKEDNLIEVAQIADSEINQVSKEEHGLGRIDEFFHDSKAELKRKSEEGEMADAKNSEDSKSPISAVHEIALQKKMNVCFEVVSESGPAHDRVFAIRLTLRCAGQFLVAEGEGPSKKQAKHAASLKMIEQLKKYPTFCPSLTTPKTVGEIQRQKVKIPKEKKRKTIIKDLKMDPNYGQQINPISRLVQIQQVKKQPEPIFTLVKEVGQARYKEYVMQVAIGDLNCQGTGPNKKLAKRAAAELMLDRLGYSKPLPKPGKPVLKHQTSFTEDAEKEAPTSAADGTFTNEQADDVESRKQRRVKFNLSENSVASPLDVQNINSSNGLVKQGRQIAPGLLFLPNLKADFPNGQPSERKIVPDSKSSDEVAQGEQRFSSAVDAKQQLLYLSDLFSFELQFTNFPKTLRDGSGVEFLSLISLSLKSGTQVFHGSGTTVDAAQTEAASAALRFFAERGLENVTKSTASEIIASNASTLNSSTNSVQQIIPDKSTLKLFFPKHEE